MKKGGIGFGVVAREIGGKEREGERRSRERREREFNGERK
jgi:hypothetical protein